MEPKQTFEQEAELTLDQKLLKQLPQLGKLFIENIPENRNFRKNPDDPFEHHHKWHQFGIITHTAKFLEYFNTQAQDYFTQWGIDKEIKEKMSEQIDGMTKEDLLRIAIVLHDLGKFERDFEEKNGKLEPDYKGHEKRSEKFIKENDKVQEVLKDEYKLTDAQIEYIARCAGLHYELGKVRSVAKKTPEGFTIAFAKSEGCKKASREIGDKFPDYKIEVGILFLCDSLAKTDVRVAAKAKTDLEAEAMAEEIKEVIEDRSLNPKLISAIKQVALNNEIAKTYLTTILNKE